MKNYLKYVLSHSTDAMRGVGVMFTTILAYIVAFLILGGIITLLERYGGLETLGIVLTVFAVGLALMLSLAIIGKAVWDVGCITRDYIKRMRRNQ